jgi:hypothetical protein
LLFLRIYWVQSFGLIDIFQAEILSSLYIYRL